MSGTPKHSVSVAGIVVRDDGRVLAVQRRGDTPTGSRPAARAQLDETFGGRRSDAKSPRRPGSTSRSKAHLAPTRTSHEASWRSSSAAAQSPANPCQPMSADGRVA